jgi:hypothetical protein
MNVKAIVKSVAPKKILGVNVEPTKSAALKEIAERFSAEYSLVDGSEGGRTVGSLFSADEFDGEVREASAVDKEILLFSGFGSKELNRVLSALRTGGCSVELKAVVTQNNINWTLSQLAEEISREHEIMHGKKDGESDNG